STARLERSLYRLWQHWMAVAILEFELRAMALIGGLPVDVKGGRNGEVRMDGGELRCEQHVPAAPADVELAVDRFSVIGDEECRQMHRASRLPHPAVVRSCAPAPILCPLNAQDTRQHAGRRGREGPDASSDCRGSGRLVIQVLAHLGEPGTRDPAATLYTTERKA